MKKLPLKLIGAAGIFLILGGAGFYFFQQKSSQTKILDNFPIMIINNGQAAIYQEVEVSRDGIKKEIVVSRVGEGEQKETKIYEYIPKEVAQKASEIEFSIQPQIIEDDPFVLWKVEPSISESVQLSYSVRVVKETTQCVEKGYIIDMKNVYKLDPYNFNDCYKYLHIKFLDAVYQNQKRREQEEKDKTQLIQPGEAKYQEIQQKAKKKIAGQVKPTATPKSNSDSKISAEEAIAIVKKNYGNDRSEKYHLGEYNLECKATFNQEDRGWRIICSRFNFVVDGSYLREFFYEFYLVSKDGKSWKNEGV